MNDALTAEVPALLGSLYLPQFEQLELRMQRRGALYLGQSTSGVATGTAWVLPVSDSCVIVDHEVTPLKDLDFYEAPRSPYACLCTCSAASVEVMPECGITSAHQVSPSGPWPSDAIYSFAYEQAEGSASVLYHKRCYRSRSICLLPGYFDELVHIYPAEPLGLFEAFGHTWSDEAALAIRTTLRRLNAQRALAPAAHLYARASIDALMAELACAHASTVRARHEQGSSQATRLAEETSRLVERMLADGHAPELGELAELLYVSRSHLCATFSAETGESLGAYIRRRRLERAAHLLEGGASAAEAATAVGYATPAAFSSAFKRQFGTSPSGWRR